MDTQDEKQKSPHREAVSEDTAMERDYGKNFERDENGKTSSSQSDVDMPMGNQVENAFEECNEEQGIPTSEVQSLKECSKTHTGKLKRKRRGRPTKVRVQKDKYRCGFCDKEFTRYSQLLVHSRVHTDERPFECKICKKSFKQKATLQDHEQTHLLDKPHKCEKCGTCFKQLRTLRQHMRLPICEKKMIRNNKDLHRKFTVEEEEQIQNVVEEDGEQPQSIHEFLDKFKDSITKKSSPVKSKKPEKTYRCEFCDKVCKSDSQLQMHRRVHTDERPFECTVCHRRFKQKSTLQGHEKTHRSDKPYSCEKCGTSFKQLRTLEQHKRLPICEKKMIKNMKSNGITVNEEKAEEVEKIQSMEEFKVRVPKDSSLPESEEFETVFRCEFCSKDFKSGSLLLRHRRIHTNERPFECKICHRRFKQKNTLEGHEATHLSHKPHTCENCGTAFKQLRTLRQHMRSTACEKKMLKNNIDPYRKQNVEDTEDLEQTSNGDFDGFSDTIPEVFSVRETQNPHAEHCCEFCSKEFSSYSVLQRHRLIHTDERPFECQTCHQRFRQKVTLQSHEATHLSDKPHKCEKCGTCFKQLRILKQHMRLPICEKKMIMNRRELQKKVIVEDAGDKAETQISGQLEKLPDETAENSSLAESGDVAKHHCSFCDKGFKFESQLEIHQRIHTDERPFECKTCQRRFKQNATLQDHEKTHLSNKPHKCEKCGTAFKQLRTLQQHMRLPICVKKMKKKELLGRTEEEMDEDETLLSLLEIQQVAQSAVEDSIQRSNVLEMGAGLEIMESNVVLDHGGDRSESITVADDSGTEIVQKELPQGFVCKVCGKVFQGKKNLVQHQRTHNEERPFVCGVCNKAFKIKPTLIEHMNVHTEGKHHSCEVCKKSFKTRKCLQNHILRDFCTGVRPYACKNCDKVFLYQSYLIKHKCGGRSRKVFECEMCDRKFSRRNLLVEHRRSHTGERPLECEDCGKKFAKRRLLRLHRLSHKERNITQNEDGVGLVPESTLENHITSHMTVHGEETAMEQAQPKHHICSRCGRSFKYLQSMLKHFCEASGIKRFQCQTCGRQFKKRHLLEIHSRVHTGIRPYACPQCDKSFSQPNTLKDHMVTHTREKNFKCDLCNSAFTRKNSLRKHKLIIHQGVEPFICQCGLTFKYKKYYNAHVSVCEVMAGPGSSVQTEAEIAGRALVIDDNNAMTTPDLEQQVIDNILGNIERAMKGAGIEIRPDVQYEIIVGENGTEIAANPE